MLLSSFSVISGLFTEGIKKIVSDKANLSYNLIALCVALVVGSVGTAIYYQLNSIPFDVNNIIYMVLLGLASGLCSMLGYDKIKQAIFQITNKQDK
jgi:Na+-driven multidrug efflux pump